MKIAVAIIVLIVGIVGFAFLSNSTKQEPTESLANNTVVYDVRTSAEFDSGHAEDAILLPLASMQAGVLPQVEKDTPIAVYCRSGNRSSQAAQILKEAGYYNVTDIGAFSNLSKYGIETTAS